MIKELPKKWVETELEQVSKKISDGSHNPPKDKGQGIPMLSGRNIFWDNITYDKVRYISEEDYKKESSRINVEPNDILLTIVGTIGRVCVAPMDIQKISLQRSVAIIKPLILSRFLAYALFGPSAQRFMMENAKGTAQKGIYLRTLKEIPLKIPHFPEQKRIVAKLDQLFRHLEELKQRLEGIPKLMKAFRQSVLTQAVTGKLTEGWRVGRELEEWENLKIEGLINSLKTDIRTGPFGSALKKSEHQRIGVPVWGIESIGKDGKFTGLNKIFVTPEKGQELKSFEVKGGDLIVSRSGTIGEICILPEDVDFGLISTNLMKIVLDNSVISSKYFCWLFIGSPFIKEELIRLCKGSTRLFITQTILKKLVFWVPPLKEQTQIVHRVEILFAKADAIEARYQKLKAKIEVLPQAILAKAFRGELVEQLNTDGDARDLLEEIRLMREEMAKKPKARKKAKK